MCTLASVTSRTKQPAAIKRPPTNKKLAAWVEALEDPSPDDNAFCEASDAVQKLYAKGLPSGLDPALVASAICYSMPHGYLIGRMVRGVGSEYDAAIVAGARRHRAKYGTDNVLEMLLVALPTEAGTRTIAESYAAFVEAERALDINPETNAPTKVSRAMCAAVQRAMAPWAALETTLELAEIALPPSEGTMGERRWINPVQCAEQWALLIVCASHPSERARALIDVRRPLVERMEDPLRALVSATLRECEGLR